MGAQVALARRISPHQGARAVTFAQALVESMPDTLIALSAELSGGPGDHAVGGPTSDQNGQGPGSARRPHHSVVEVTLDEYRHAA